MIAALYGCDHPDLDTVAHDTVGQATAIALTCGRFPKGYQHVDPNEDAVLAAECPAGRLLAVADGHNGVEASHAVIRAIAEHADKALDGSLSPSDALEDLLDLAIHAVAAVVGHSEPPRDRSRTALSLALVTDGAVYAGTWGDIVVAVVRGRKVRLLGGSAPFLGPRSILPPTDRVRLRRGDVVVALTDGVTDFLGGGWQTELAISVAETASAGQTALRLIETAMAGGAGDNAAAAVADA